MDSGGINQIDRAISLLAGEPASGHAVFAVAAEALEIGLSCRWIGILYLVEAPDTVQFLARRTDGAIDSLDRYSIAGTPCAGLYENRWPDNYCFLEKDASRQSTNPAFAALGGEFYCSEAFYDADGKVVGHVYVMDDKPRQDNPQSRAFFRLVVQRVGAGYNRWRVQEELQDREQMFKDFAETSSDWLWELDDQYRYTYVSAQSEIIRGRPAGYFIGETPFDTRPDEMEAQPWLDLRAAMDRREPFRDFLTKRTVNGRTTYISTSGTPVYDRSGRFVGYRGTSSDVTVAVEAREQLRDAIDSISEAFALWDNEDRLIIWNKQFVDISRVVEDIIQPGVTFTELVRALVDRGQYVGVEHQTEKWIQDRIALHRQGHDPVVRKIADGRWLKISERPTQSGGVVGIWTDITDLKNREREIEINEARFRDFAESSSDWFWETDTEHRMTFLSSGPGNSIENSDVIGRPRWDSDDLLPGSEEFWALHRADIEARRPFRDFRFSTRGKDGRIRNFKASGRPIYDENDTFMGYRGTTTDVTEQIALEEQLAQSQKMEAVGQLTGGVAHDFNNLLAIIVGNLEMIRDDLPSDDALQRYLEPAMRSAKRGGELTHRLLAFSRRQTLEPENTDTNALMDGIADIIRRTLGPAIEIEISLGEGLWPAFIDSHQLENAIVNLAINARDAMPGGGKLTIETANTTLDELYTSTQQDVAPGDYVMVAISDTGHGMSPEVIAKAFEPFFTTKEVGRGTGLGLSMVYGFVKQSHGHVRIYSEENQGTSVKLYLPRATAEASDRMLVSTERSSETEGTSATLLVVEDDPDVRDLTVTQLSLLGYRVLEAGDGKEALQLFADTPNIDMVITDLALPGGMNGHDIALAIRDKNPSMPMLIVSGYTEGALSRQDRLPEDLRILHKPFTKAQLADAVSSALKD